MRPLLRLVLGAMTSVAASQSTYGDAADRAVDRIVENLRWTYYWFGKTGIEHVYAEGKTISALVFWHKNDSPPISGLCSTDISICVAYSGVYLDPAERQMPIGQSVTSQQAFAAFISSGLRDASHRLAVEGLSPNDFQIEQRSITLPVLEPPSSIVTRVVPEEATREAEKVRRLFGCWGVEAETRPRGCMGSLVFAYYGARDPYWFVLRACAMTCEFKGESVEMLRRGDHGWEVTSGGFIGSPKAEVDRLKQQIERAAMFRVPL